MEGAVGFHAEVPAAGEGLEPVVGAAEAAQVGAGRLAVVGVREDVVEVGPADALGAVGHPAGAVAGGDEAFLAGGVGVPVGGRGWSEDRAAAVTFEVVGAAGFGEAQRTIVDANLTALIAALALFQFGSGPVKGFAVTLGLGVVTNMFTAVYFSRYLVALWYDRVRPAALPL